MESSFSVKLEDKTVVINLEGRLDTTNAPLLSEEVGKLIGQPISRIVFMMKNLEYISSAGLRVIVFAKQKLGVDTKVFVIAPQPDVLDVIKMTGFDSFLTIQDSYE